MVGLLYAIVTVLIVLWLVGFLLVHVGGPLIHLLLVVAAILVIYQFITGRRVV